MLTIDMTKHFSSKTVDFVGAKLLNITNIYDFFCMTEPQRVLWRPHRLQ